LAKGIIKEYKFNTILIYQIMSTKC